MVTLINNVMPTAHITVKKGRRKVYNGNNIYLDNGTEFEIELFNPESQSILAIISINGKELNSSGLVIKPGQRVFLERYFDSANKFKFDTYEVSANNQQVKMAIQDNGKIEIKFKREMINNYWYGNTIYNSNPIYTTDGTPGIYYSNTSGIIGTLNLTSSNTSNVNCSSEPDIRLRRSMETGRIEKGEKSDQEFTSVNMNFEYTYFHTISYQILPNSTKPMTTDEIKVYCSKCGSKSKKGDNFCRKCGNKL